MESTNWRQKKHSRKFWKEKLEFARHQQLLSIDSMDKNLGKLWEMVRDREARHAAVLGFAKSRTHLGNWTTTNNYLRLTYAELNNCADNVYIVLGITSHLEMI